MTREIRVTDVIYIGDEILVTRVFFISDACFSASPKWNSGIVRRDRSLECLNRILHNKKPMEASRRQGKKSITTYWARGPKERRS